MNLVWCACGKLVTYHRVLVSIPHTTELWKHVELRRRLIRNASELYVL